MKERLDTILFKRGLYPSRSRAAAAILSGKVKVVGARVTKAGARYADDVEVETEPDRKYVSRGGLKLERAFEVFKPDVKGLVTLDGGASTGGFTDCLLNHGASKVIAVDVGYGQFDWSLRRDPRVEVLERTNLRYLKPDDLSEPAAFATLDLSFISLKKVLDAVIKCLLPGFGIVALIKPQFEAGRDNIGKGGVVRDLDVHRRVIADIWDFAESLGCAVRGLTDSGIKGPKGNVEYLIYLIDGKEVQPRDQAIKRDAQIEVTMKRVANKMGPA